ncbi:Stage II sporulation protein Q [Chlamydia abortus]|uniref:M23 family metallopeptidase n=1 Tax=Paenibacillus sp. SAFN-117 TaxID=3436860 RepID=UPI000A27BE40|nr:Stage II sporulation protein Q [Chlamydia abortus]
MSEQNKEIQTEKEAPQSKEGAQTATPYSPWRRLLAKKWAFPALYMVAAAIILTLMLVYQNSGKQPPLTDESIGLGLEQGENATDPDAQPVAANVENMQWPVKDYNEMDVTMPFFDSKASSDVKQEAMVEYGDTFTPHIGVDLARPDKESFEVLAALSGKVTAVERNPVVGNLVEITHSNGLVTVYQSLDEIKVAKDVEVKKGDVIGTAGRNELEKHLGNHLHFEVRQGQDGAALNPSELIAEQ